MILPRPPRFEKILGLTEHFMRIQQEIEQWSRRVLRNDSDQQINAKLTLNQGGEDGGILDFKSTDVAHGLTDYGETESYATMSKGNAAEGGLRVDSFAEDAAVSVATQFQIGRAHV